MIDLRIITIKDLLTVTKVRFLPGVLPRSLEIQGLRFRQADEVYVNNLPAPEFVAVSDTKLLAQIPDSQSTSLIRAVSVLATRPSPNRKSVLRFEMGRGLATVQGIEKLVQHFIKILIQNPGTDIFAPAEGGGLRGLVGRSVNKDEGRALRSAVVSAASRTRDQVVARQSRTPRLPPDERLLRAEVLGVGFSPSTTALAVRLGLGAVSGKEAVANLTF